MNFCTSQDELNFDWSDGKRLHFSNWAANNEKLDDCVILDTDGFWKTAGCNDNQPGAICYYPGSMEISNVMEFIHLVLQNLMWGLEGNRVLFKSVFLSSYFLCGCIGIMCVWAP